MTDAVSAFAAVVLEKAQPESGPNISSTELKAIATRRRIFT
ncbi:MAG: hypothetical protein PVI02_05835 [Gammaproteobacteria bacterium]